VQTLRGFSLKIVFRWTVITDRQESWRASRNGSWLLGEEVSLEVGNEILV